MPQSPSLGNLASLDYGQGIHAVDADYLRPGLAAVHLIIENGRVALVDTGANNAVPRVLAALAGMGLGPEAVDYVIATHVHLDHAGASGEFIRQCPNARLVVHPRGARHLIDPSRLVQGSMAVYGAERFAELYGEIVPVPEERVIEADDGHTIDLSGRTLVFLDTPGHARHHFCVHDPVSGGIFTGDTFGISYREFDVDGAAFIFPTTTPVQFEPEAAHASIDRLMALAPTAAYLTHFGRVTDLPRLAADLHGLLDDYVALTRAAPGVGEARHQALKVSLDACLRQAARRHGCQLDDAAMSALLANDVELNAQGLLVWRDRAAG